MLTFIHGNKNEITIQIENNKNVLNFILTSPKSVYKGRFERLNLLNKYKIKNSYLNDSIVEYIQGLMKYPIKIHYLPTSRTGKEQLLDQIDSINGLVYKIRDNAKSTRETFGREFKNKVFEELFTPHTENKYKVLDSKTKNLLNKLPKYSKDFALEESSLANRVNEMLNYIDIGDDLIRKVSLSKDNLDSDTARKYVNYYQSLTQIDIITKIVPIFEKWTKIEEEILRPLDQLKISLDNFFSYSKEIVFDFENDMLNYYRTDNKGSKRKIELSSLSSGELQLIVLFANGYLNDYNKIRTLIIDEPELSLHREWKLHLVGELKKMPKSPQVICATHSSEIIHYHKSCVKTIKITERV